MTEQFRRRCGTAEGVAQWVREVHDGYGQHGQNGPHEQHGPHEPSMKSMKSTRSIYREIAANAAEEAGG